MPRLSFRQLIITTLLGFSLCFPSTVFSVNAQEAPLSGAAKVRQDIEQQRLKKQETEKQFTLKQGAATVAAQRAQEIQKQLQEAQARATAEATEAKSKAAGNLEAGTIDGLKSSSTHFRTRRTKFESRLKFDGDLLS